MNVLEYNPSSIILNNGAYVASFVLLVEVDTVRRRRYDSGQYKLCERSKLYRNEFYANRW